MPKLPEEKGELNAKQLDFCRQYLIDRDAKKAAERAGYSPKTAGSIGCQLLTLLKVQEQIQIYEDQRAERTQITADLVLRELAKIGFSMITDYLEVKEIEAPVNPLEGLKQAMAEQDEGQRDWFLDEEPQEAEEAKPKEMYTAVNIFPTAKMKPDAIAAISSIKRGRNGIEVKLHDKNKALELIARHLGMLNDKLQLGADESLKNLYKNALGDD